MNCSSSKPSISIDYSGIKALEDEELYRLSCKITAGSISKLENFSEKIIR